MRPSGFNQIYLYDQAVDMRKSFEGLSQLIECAYPGQLLSGAHFLFLNRRRNLIKILYWEGDGFAIWYKSLEQGTFSSCFSGENQLTRQQFTMLLEGVFPRRLSNNFPRKDRHLTSLKSPVLCYINVMFDGVESITDALRLQEILQQKDNRIVALEADLLPLKEQLPWFQAEQTEEIQYQRRKPSKNRGKDTIAYPDNLPVKTIELDLSPEEKVCPETGDALVELIIKKCPQL